MLSLVKELTKPRRELYKIKVLNIFSPNILIATFEDCRKPIPATSEYLTMEHRIARGWHHSPGWNFTASPDVGTFVMVMLKNKSNFKRGAVLNMEQIGDTKYFDVFLYDWGVIKRFTIRSLVKLPQTEVRGLVPRTFVILLAGMLEVPKKPTHSHWEDGTPNCLGAAGFNQDLCPDRGAKRARRWIDKRCRIYVDIFKSFGDVIYTSDIKGVKAKNLEDPSVKRECFSSAMRKHRYLYLDKELRRLDKDPELNNWDTAGSRLDQIIPLIGPAFDDETENQKSRNAVQGIF